ncbi:MULTISPECIES: hypothetical protein [unclassified Streptomyces]|uniref:hypothetical protein n=1 Tax=unclassified Streptomyces TaxID=2593676 RepID=UPI001F03CA64|nr:MULTISPECIES: hypothetical protein [unclassified Streptomyces]MCH0563617.1 hypothetical protein [Streptomyces sp. MUM 2J]MCH0570750.1 hypothetical protein [Streptomyces sp. MUM 136J]
MHPLHLVIDSVGYVRAVRTIYSVIGVVIEPAIDGIPSIAVVNEDRHAASQHIVRVRAGRSSSAFLPVSDSGLSVSVRGSALLCARVAAEVERAG